MRYDNRLKVIVRLIPSICFMLMGVFLAVVSVLGTLEHFGVISNTWTITNFSWFGLILAGIMAFCFIFIPLRKIIKVVRAIKTNSPTKQVETVVVSVQNAPINLMDVDVEHNRNLKQEKTGGKTQQVNTQKTKTSIIILSVLVALFAFPAILCFVNAIVPNPWITGTVNGKPADSRDSWKIGVVILCFLVPLVWWLFSEIKGCLAIKHNKPIKTSQYGFWVIPFSVLIAIITLFFMFMDAVDFKDPMIIVFLSFCGFFFVLLSFGFLYDVIGNHKDNKLLNDNLAVRGTARYVGCKFTKSVVSTVNGASAGLKAWYRVKFAFTDGRGNEIVKTSHKEYTFKEVAYLKYKQEFEILFYGKRAVIVEDLTNIDIPSDKNINLDVSGSEKSLPSFAKNHRPLLMLILALGVCAFLEWVGILMLVNTNGDNSTGIVCVVIGVVILAYSMYLAIPSMLAEYWGKEAVGQLLSLETHHNKGAGIGQKREYAVVNINGQIKKIYLWYSEWYSLLGVYVGKEIPVKVFGKAAVVDFKKLYSDLI